MNKPPLNPDALEAAERWMQEKSATFGLHWKNAKPIIETYLSAALPETRCVERHSPDLVCDGCEPPTPALPEVTSVEELRALPIGSVIIDGDGDAGILEPETIAFGETRPLPYPYVAKHYLPARVLYRPEVKP